MNHIDRTALVPAAHGFNGGSGAGIGADGHLRLSVRQGFGQGRRSDADGPDGLAGCGQIGEEPLDFRMDGGLRPFEGKITQILGRSEAAGHDQRVEVSRLHVFEILDLATGDAGRFHQHVPLFRRHFLRQVIDHMRLFHIGRHAYNFRPRPVKRQQRQHRLMNLSSIKHATS